MLRVEGAVEGERHDLSFLELVRGLEDAERSLKGER